MKRTFKLIMVVMLVAVMFCGCVGPQVTITPESSATQGTTDGPTSQPTDTPGPDCITTGPTDGPTQEITTTPTEEITTPPTEEITNPPTQESNPTPTPTGTKEVVAGPTVTHQEVSEWDYFFS